ncbi:MAG: hypothetical protein AB2A00_03140 [Myxococcota bacterium]
MMLRVACVMVLLGAAAPSRADEQKASLAVFPLEAKVNVPAPVAELLTEALVAEMRAANVFTRVVTPQDIAALMPPEQQKFLMRCASDECALVDQDMAGALGVTHLLVGNMGKLGSSYLLNLRMLEVASSKVVATLSQRFKGKDEEALLDALHPAAEKMIAQARLAPLAPTPPPVPAPVPETPTVRELVATPVPDAPPPATAPPPAPTTEKPPEPAPTGAFQPAVAARAVGIAGAAMFALVLMLSAGLYAGAGVVAGVDFLSGGRPGGTHKVNANVAFLANVALGGAVGLSALALVMGVVFSAAFGISLLAP